MIKNHSFVKRHLTRAPRTMNTGKTILLSNSGWIHCKLLRLFKILVNRMSL